MRVIKIISAVLIVVFWLIMSIFCGDNLIVHGANALITIFIMTGSFLYGSLTLWLLYGLPVKNMKRFCVGLLLALRYCQ